MTVEFMKAMYGKLTEVVDVGPPVDYNAFYDAVGGRIYAAEGPPTATFPLCIFNIESMTSTTLFGNRIQSSASFVITIFADAANGPDSIIDIEKLLHTHLNEKNITVESHDRGFVRNTSRGVISYEDQLIEVSSTYSMIATTV